MGQRFKVFTTKPHFTKTHYAELLNNIIYRVTTAQALVAFADPSMFPDTQNKTQTASEAEANKVQPLYTDVQASDESTMYM